MLILANNHSAENASLNPVEAHTTWHSEYCRQKIEDLEYATVGAPQTTVSAINQTAAGDVVIDFVLNRDLLLRTKVADRARIVASENTYEVFCRDFDGESWSVKMGYSGESLKDLIENPVQAIDQLLVALYAQQEYMNSDEYIDDWDRDKHRWGDP